MALTSRCDQKIQLADQAIIAYAACRIAQNDVVLVFASSYTVEQVLLHIFGAGCDDAGG